MPVFFQRIRGSWQLLRHINRLSYLLSHLAQHLELHISPQFFTVCIKMRLMRD